MISRFFKKKLKPKPNPKKAAPVSKARPKKSVTKTVSIKKEIKKTPPSKPVKNPTAKVIEEESPPEQIYHFSPPTLKAGKIITAEGWKRIMMRKASKK